MVERTDWADMAEVPDMADMAEVPDMADRANSRVILPTIAYIDGKSEIMNHSVTYWQHQLQEYAIASKNGLYLIKSYRLSLLSYTERSILTNEVALYQLQFQTLSYPIARYQQLSYRIVHVF